MFVKLRSRVCASWCLGRELVKMDCMMVVVTGATHGGKRNSWNAYQEVGSWLRAFKTR